MQVGSGALCGLDSISSFRQKKGIVNYQSPPPKGRNKTNIQGSIFSKVTGSTPGTRMISPFEVSLQTGVLDVPKRYIGHISTNFGNIRSA